MTTQWSIGFGVCPISPTLRNKRMTTDLVSRALIKAYNLRLPPAGLVFHSDRGSQYTSRHYRKLLSGYQMRASMGDVGACWDNAVFERFFGSLKHDWLFKVAQPTRDHMKSDVAKYMRYYNVDRLHTANGDLAPVTYEISKNNSVVENGRFCSNRAGSAFLYDGQQAKLVSV